MVPIVSKTKCPKDYISALPGGITAAKFLIHITVFTFLFLFLQSCTNEKTSDENSKLIDNTVTIDLKWKFVRKNQAQIVYEPDSNVKKSHYTNYYFKSDEFLKIIPALKTNGITRIKININHTKKERSKPSNPKLSSPHGGFWFTSHYCRLISVIQ